MRFFRIASPMSIPAIQTSAPSVHTDWMTPLKLCCRNVPKAELLDDLKRVAKLLNVPTLNQAQYRRHGRFSPVTFPKRFGDWNSAMAAAGLAPSRNFRVPAADVLADIRLVAAILKTEKLSGTQYVAHGKYSLPIIYRHFGNWQGAVKVAGITPILYRIETDQELFDNLERIWRTLNRQPRSIEITAPLSQFGISPYQRRFGGFNNALQAFVRHIQSRAPDAATPAIAPLDLSAFLPHKTSRIVNARLRYSVLERDHFRCRACGRSPATEPEIRLQIDHKKPWSRGGETVLENLQTLCWECNSGKSDQDGPIEKPETRNQKSE